MPNLPGWNDVETVELGGDFKRLPAGAYVACLGPMTAETAKSGKTYYQCVFDIFEGEHKGHYDDDFGRKHPGLHAVKLYVSSEKAMGVSKGTLNAITESNKGFDAEAAFVGDRFEDFRGKLVGVVLGEEEYEDRKTGDTKLSLTVRRCVPAADARSGKISVPDVKTLDGDFVPAAEYERPESHGGGTVQTAGAAHPADPSAPPAAPGSVYAADVPF